MIKILFLTLLLLPSFGFAEDADHRTTLEKYQGDNYYYLISCELMFKSNLLKAELDEAVDPNENYHNCISTSKEQSQKNLNKALSTIKKSAAKQALKKYHVSFVAALYGIEPNLDEIKLLYAQRQNNLKEKMTEAWATFETEQ